MELNSTEKKIIAKLDPVREQVVAYMNENIKTYEGRMSSVAIREALGITEEQVSQTDFQLGLSMAIRKGVITGFRGVKGKFGGYCPIGTGPAAKSESTEDGKASCINLGEGARLVSNDSLNWSLEGCGVTRYWGSLEQACAAVSRILLNEKVRKLTEDGVDMTKIVDIVLEAEASIAKQIREAAAPVTVTAD